MDGPASLTDPTRQLGTAGAPGDLLPRGDGERTASRPGGDSRGAGAAATAGAGHRAAGLHTGTGGRRGAGDAGQYGARAAPGRQQSARRGDAGSGDEWEAFVTRPEAADYLLEQSHAARDTARLYRRQLLLLARQTPRQEGVLSWDERQVQDKPWLAKDEPAGDAGAGDERLAWRTNLRFRCMSHRA